VITAELTLILERIDCGTRIGFHVSSSSDFSSYHRREWLETSTSYLKDDYLDEDDKFDKLNGYGSYYSVGSQEERLEEKSTAEIAKGKRP